MQPHRLSLSVILMLGWGLFCVFFTAPMALASDTTPNGNVPVKEHPLEPPDTSSPRATLYSFINYAEKQWLLASDREIRTVANNDRGLRTLDVSKLPPAVQDDAALEAGLLLFDVFNRISIPEAEEIPDALQVKQDQLKRWTIPHTAITIALETEGPRAGEWLFTSDVVNNAKEYYYQTRHLPLKSGAVIEDGYRLYLSSSGELVSWVRLLPAWAHAVYFEQTLWQWGLMILILVIAGLFILYSLRWTFRPCPSVGASIQRKLAGSVSIMLATSLVLYLLNEQLNITGATGVVVRSVLYTVFYLAMAWGVMLLGSLVAERIIARPSIKPESASAQLIRMSMTIASLGVSLFVVVAWGQSLSIPVAGILTGLGIGGIAVALAAQSTLENFIGSITLYIDPPVRVGEFCSFGDKEGTVEHVGWRATRIRTRERSVLTIPNAEFSKLQIDNRGLRDRILYKTILNLRLETTSEQLNSVLFRIKEILQENKSIDKDPARVRLVSIGPYSLDIEIFAYVITTDINEFLRVQEEISIQILHEIEKAGTALAPPASIHYQITEKPIESVDNALTQ